MYSMWLFILYKVSPLELRSASFKKSHLIQIYISLGCRCHKIIHSCEVHIGHLNKASGIHPFLKEFKYNYVGLDEVQPWKVKKKNNNNYYYYNYQACTGLEPTRDGESRLSPE